MDMRDKARQGFLMVEQQIGYPLGDQPIAQRDQWGAGLRDTFAKMDVDLNDRKQSNAAWAGAQIMLFTMLPHPSEPMSVAGSHVVRYLLDRSEGEPNVARVSWFVRLRLWLAGKAMPKC